MLLILCVRPGGEVGMGMSELCVGGCPQQLIGCPFSPVPPMDNLLDHGPSSCLLSLPVQLQGPPAPQRSLQPCGGPPSPNEDHQFLGSGFYQLQLNEPFGPEGPNGGTAGSGNGAPHRLQVDFTLPSASPPSNAILPPDLGAFSSFLCPPPV